MRRGGVFALRVTIPRADVGSWAFHSAARGAPYQPIGSLRRRLARSPVVVQRKKGLIGGLSGGTRGNYRHVETGPLDNHRPEKARRKRPIWSNLTPNCATHGGCLVRRKARELGALPDACAPGDEVRGLAGGEARIRTRGSCLMLASPAASEPIWSFPWRAARASGEKAHSVCFSRVAFSLASRSAFQTSAGLPTSIRPEKSSRIAGLPTSRDSNWWWLLGTSALVPIADSGPTLREVRFVPRVGNQLIR